MATSLASPVSSEWIPARDDRQDGRFTIVLVTALTFAALLVHGYHPYAEDGGVYMPEIKRLVDPALYPYGTGFVVGHLHYSIFAPMIAELARLAHLRVETVLFGVYLATFWMTLFAASLLASRCYRSREARWGAVTLLAVWMTLPIAGTSLMLMDPYVTARSISTPCALLALVGALDFLLPFANRRPETNPDTSPDTNTNVERQMRGAVLCFVSLAIASAMHPLMGAYAVGSVLLLSVLMWPSRIVQVWGMLGLSLAALATAVGVLLSAPPESAIFTHVVLTRYYWFIAEWHWYELIGVIAPLLIVAFVAFVASRPRRHGDAARIGLARMAFAAGLLATLVAVFFARAGMQTHAVARLQPLRIFQLVYIIMILVLGATLAEQVLRQKAWRWAVLFSLLASIMLSADRLTFPASPDIEYASKTTQRGSTVPGNPWEQAFVWISRNTPRDAVFAMNAHYITQPGEDAQGFRAIAERSALPDFSKDGGVVTNKPELAAPWLKGLQAQAGLDAEPDASRVAALKPLGVTWVVLESGDATRFACEYANAVVKVCRLP